MTRSSAPYGSTNQVMTGLGMVEGGGALNPDNVRLFAITAVRLYDGRTFERLASLRAGSSTLFTEIGGDANLPHRRLDRTWWPATPRAVHSAKIKTATRALLNESLAKTVPAIMGIKTRSAARGKGGSWSPFKP